MIDFNKTHCDKCGLKVERGEGIYASGGFYHKEPCWEEVKKEFINSYEWEELKTALEDNATCPYCGHIEINSWELCGDDGTNICGRCEKEYNFTRNVEITYSTSPIEREV